MKIWKRIFLYAFILFFIVFSFTGVIVIENIYSRNKNRALKNAIEKEKDIISSIYMNSDLLYGQSVKALLSITNSYTVSNSNEIVRIEIFDEKGEAASIGKNVMPEGIERLELSEISEEESKFIIRCFEEKQYVFVSSILRLDNKKYKIVVTTDISYLDGERKENYFTVITLGSISIIFLAIGLYIISKKVTEPIKNLSRVSSLIKDKNYSERIVYENSNDEIGVLATNFNCMVDVIEENIDELEKLNNEKQRFIDNLTHEIKTPITSIIGYTDLLIKGNINNVVKEKAIKHIHKQGYRLENLSTSMTKLIKVRKKNIVRENIDIKCLIENVLENTSYKREELEIKVINNINSGYILVDKDLVDVLLANIIDNAIKASKAGDVIKIYGGKSKNKYEVVIEDFGIGIAKDDLDKIKEPFYMVDKSRANKTKNLGLGLAICTEICELNKIKFNIESELKKGTKVKLYFEMREKCYESNI
ncbi:MAG: sensor histidine kinase [Sarcina sp.]